MKKYILIFLSAAALFSSCIKDDIIEDFVEPTIRITTLLDTIEINSTFQFEYKYLNNVGIEEEVSATWTSSNPQIIDIDASGLATAKEVGMTSITVEYSGNESSVMETVDVHVGNSTVVQDLSKSGTIRTTTSYVLEGSFTIEQVDSDLVLEFADDYVASSALPGLYIYLTNNKSTNSNAFEIGAVETFQGAHSYTIENVDINDYNFLLYYCKPFNVKVGDGDIE